MPDVGSAEEPFAPVLNALYPPGTGTTAHSFVAGLDFGTSAPWRPYTIVNFVSTLDGRATIDGHSEKLGGPADLAMMLALRERADALLVGTGTLAKERYGEILADPQAQARRTAAARLPQPLIVTMSRKGQIPFNIPLFTEPDARIVVFSPMRVTLPRVSAQVIVELIPDGTGDAWSFMVRRLHERFGVRLLLCEGGPTLFGALAHAGLVDELCLTLSPKLAGRAGNRTILESTTAPSQVTDARLLSVLAHDDELLLRYGLGEAKS